MISESPGRPELFLELLGGERWHVQLEPHPEGLSQSQVPDWFGYRPI